MNIHKIILKFVSISFSILVTLLVAIGLLRLGEYCYHFGYRVFTEPAMEEEPGTDVVVLLTGDMSEYDIGGALLEKGLIRDKNLFFAQLMLSAYAGELQSGTYTLNTSMTAKEMMAVMAADTAESTEETEEPLSTEGTGASEAPGTLDGAGTNEDSGEEEEGDGQGNDTPGAEEGDGQGNDTPAAEEGDGQGNDTPEAEGNEP